MGTERSGSRPSRRGQIRLRDVAEATGVDTSVVSRVLSGDARLSIRPETRQRILEASTRLNYRPNPAARTLKTARTMAVGMAVPDLDNMVYASIARGAQERASAAGYVLLIATGSAGERLRDLRGRCDGLLLAIATSETVRPGDLDGAPPVLLVNRSEAIGLPSVTVDDAAGSALAVRHLLSLGHRRVDHLAGPQNADTARRRLRGYVTTMEEAGLRPRPEWIVEGSFDERGGHVAASRLLRSKPRPTAVFVANIRAAVGAIAAAKSLGLRVPEDVSLVGFHDVSLAAYLDPPLTTVRMPLVEMGSQAMDSLLAVIAGQPVEDLMVSTPPELVVRASSAPPPD
jgi:LacI family transcriptional regulator